MLDIRRSPSRWVLPLDQCRLFRHPCFSPLLNSSALDLSAGASIHDDATHHRASSCVAIRDRHPPYQTPVAPSDQPPTDKLIEARRSIQRDPMTGAFDLLIAPRPFHEALRHLHPLSVDIVVVRRPDAKR